MSSEFDRVVFPDAFGFCGGVRAADELLEHVATEAQAAGVDVYGYHDVVHNKDVTSKHTAAGITFVGDIDAIPSYSAVVISAHGASPEVFNALAQKGSEVFDATCPLVTRTHKGAREARAAGEKVLYICKGKPGDVEKLHDEVAGMVGHLDYEINDQGELSYKPVARAFFEIGDNLTPDDLSPNAKYRIIWQTTLHAQEADAYRNRLQTEILAAQPNAEFGDIPANYVCNAVQVRQEGVQKLVNLGLPRIVVVTDPTSKNGMGYVDMAKQLAGETQEVVAVANAAEAAQFADTEVPTGITASASTPDNTISEVAALLGADTVPETDKKFSLPDSKAGAIGSKMAQLLERRREVAEGPAA